MDQIASSHVSKVVLARKTTLTFSKTICPFTLLKSLPSKRSSLFLFQFSSHCAFIGSTPEILYKKDSNNLESFSIAGTRSRGKTVEEDELLERELLSSEKDLEEFDFVKQGITTQLTPYTTEISWSDTDVIKTSRVQHLHSKVSARLLEGTSDAILISALHPTPATGGYPKSEALILLKKLEPFDRGWYGAPVGFISQKRSLILVAIRSALIRKNILQLYAGSGIVTGSEAESEWQELENKTSQFFVWEREDEEQMVETDL